MPVDTNCLIDTSLKLNATRAAIADVSKLRFSKEFRHLCEKNSCGKYGTNWTCPPAVGAYEELKAKACAYKQGLVFQTVHQLADSFDYEGMTDAKKIHWEVFRNILGFIKDKFAALDILPLNAGACTVCSRCSYLDGKECYFPDKAVSSVEAYGIDVAALVHGCGFSYNNGANTVSYVGLILFNDNE